MAGIRKNLIGQSFGRLTCLALAEQPKDRHDTRYICRCKCGVEKSFRYSTLTQGKTKSCGCLRKEITIKRFTKHGRNSNGKHDIYRAIWSGINNRCNNPKNKSYHTYGGKGIKVYPLWSKNFEVFCNYLLNTLGPRPGKNFSLDRIDGDKNYEPGNLRWATLSHQTFNQKVKKSNKLGIRGVSACYNGYRATIIANGMRKHLGVFRTIEDAITAYKKAALDLYGELPPDYR